ncbi:MAG: TonB-dependent receptor [Acidobacteriota bacterium]
MQMRISTNRFTKVLQGTFLSPRIAAVALLAVYGCQIAGAQAVASMSGKVEDPSGAAVQNATVTIKSIETGTSRQIMTDADGTFKVSALRVGPQEVRAEKTGFKTAVRSGINLAVAQEAIVNLKLEVGPVLDQVNVTADTPVVNVTTSSVSGLVGEQQVKDLPLNGRSFDNLITLNAGAINYGLKSPQTSTSNGSTFSVAGRRPLENLFLLNGVEYGGSSQLAVTPGGVSGQLLGIDAVREFNVLTDSYSAEYGKRAGAQVSIVTMSGTNALHGSVFEFARNSAFDARNYFDRATVPGFKRNQFGGSLGGPIKKDKIFLFGNFEGFVQRLAVSNVSVVPDAQARLGQLPNATTGIYSTVTNLNPAMLQYMAFWPVANGPELMVNGIASGTALSYNNPRQKIRESFGTLRGDYNIGIRDAFSVNYTVDDGVGTIPLADPLFASTNILRNQVASMEETHVFSPNVVNIARIGFSRSAFNYDSALLTTFSPSLSFVQGAGPGGIVIGGGATTTGLAALTAAGPNNAAGVSNRRNLFTYTDQVHINKGMHQISAGVWFQRLQDNEDSASRRSGQASFASLTTFLQGTVTTFQVVPNTTALGWRSLFSAAYVQDNIKLLPNLQLQIGLRHESTTGWNEASGRAANYVTDAAGALVTDTRVASSVFTKNNAKHLWAPRAGLAWDIFGNGKTAFRAGYGTYYTMIDALAFLLNSLPPANGSISKNGTLFPFTQILPNTTIAPSCSPTQAQPCTTWAPQGIQPDAQTPAVQEWNASIEQQLSSNMALRISYVGSFATHQFLSIDPNSITPRICASATCASGGVGAATARSTVALGQQYIPVGTRPNPYLSGGFFWYTEGNARYNALQLEVTRRMVRGFQFRTNYTFSKNLDMNSGLTGAQSNNQAQMIMDRTDLKRDWGPSALNVKHQFSASASYELPFGAGKRWMNGANRAAQQVIGGWQLNLIETLLSGFPFTPQVGSNRSGDGDTRNPDRPNVNPNFTGPVVLGKQSQWFNPAAFSIPSFGTFGNLGRGVYTGPGLATTDLSAFKTIAINERIHAQFRAEAFNLLNHTNLASPNAIVFAGTGVSSSAGLITSTATSSRQIQLGLKLTF